MPRTRAATDASFQSLNMNDDEDDVGEHGGGDVGEATEEDALWIQRQQRLEQRNQRPIRYLLLIQIVLLVLLWAFLRNSGESVEDKMASKVESAVNPNDTSAVVLVDEPFQVPIPATEPCRTNACRTAGKEYRSDSDTSIDPCVDFYAYACNGWVKSHPLSDGVSRFTRFDELHKENQQVLKTILEGLDPPEKIKGMTEEEYKVDIANLEKCRGMYHACMDVDTLYAVGVTPLFPLLTLARTFNDTVGEKEAPNVLAEVLAKLARKGIGAFIGIDVSPDSKAPIRNVLRVSQSGLTFKELEGYRRQSVMAAFPGMIVDVLARIERAEHGRDVSSTRRIELRTIAEAIAKFETDLAAIQVGEDKLVDPELTYNPYHVPFAARDIPSMNITHYLDTLVSEPPSDIKFRFKEDTKILITVPEYFPALHNLLASTSRSTIQWYLVWRVITAYGTSLDVGTKKLMNDITGLISGTHGTVDTSRRWEKCVSNVEDAMNSLIMRYYVQKSFPGESKSRSLEVADDIIGAFRDQAAHLDWLDDVTRKSVYAKLDMVKKKIGYPDTPNLDSPPALATYYAELKVDPKKHFENMVSWQAFETMQNLKKLDRLASGADENWGMSAISANAFYSRVSNEIVFPAGILRTPYFDAELPDYVNFGAIGMFMGHELSHGFDDSGRKYDGQGKLVSWWTEKTTAAFEEKSTCFAEQFGNFTVKGPDGVEAHVNTVLTMSEILADASGLNQAEKAWRKKTQDGKARNLLLPGFDKTFSADQLFFQSYARAFCATIRPEGAILRIHTDTHPPLNHRVNGALQNSEGFSKAFKCKLGAPMNPIRKCRLW